jgi:hypothetical protein
MGSDKTDLFDSLPAAMLHELAELLEGDAISAVGRHPAVSAGRSLPLGRPSPAAAPPRLRRRLILPHHRVKSSYTPVNKK